MSAHFGKKFGVFVNSGSSANLLGLATLGIGPGDEVVTPACTFATTVAPIVQLGATPVFVDIQFRTIVPTVADVMAAVTDKTMVIMLPNLVGSKPDWKKIREETDKINKAREGGDLKQIKLFEDSADTCTCTPETDVAICSFYASHIMTCGGGGGIVMFNTMEHKKKALCIRDWGRTGDNSEDMSVRFQHSVDGIPYDFKFLYSQLGYNLKSCEMNCAFGLVQFKKLEQFKLTRRTNVKTYIQQLQDLAPKGLVVPDDLPIEDMQDWLAMPLMYADRSKLLHYLEDHDIQTRVCFAGNITRHPAYRQFYGDYPIADKLMKEGFLLGAHHGLNKEDITYVCKVIRSFFDKL